MFLTAEAARGGCVGHDQPQLMRRFAEKVRMYCGEVHRAQQEAEGGDVDDGEESHPDAVGERE